MNEVALIAVAKGDDYLEVHPTTLKAHKAAGWKECPKREAAERDGALKSEVKASDGLTVAQIKEALAAKSIAIPDGTTLKADLAALLDAAQAST